MFASPILIFTSSKYCFQATHDHKLLNRLAGKITDWDELRTVGLELESDPDDIARLQAENRSVRTAAYKVLSSWYDRVISPDKEKWAMLKSALEELGKDGAVVELGIDVLCGDTSLQPTLGASGDGNSRPSCDPPRSLREDSGGARFRNQGAAAGKSHSSNSRFSTENRPNNPVSDSPIDQAPTAEPERTQQVELSGEFKISLPSNFLQ